MASKYWIKLYHEILHDPKMGQLPDRLWRRVIELFLLAGEFDLNGELPTTEEICWTLRITENECNETLQCMQRLGVAHCNDNAAWVITNFADRQAANTSTERSRAHRERKRQEKQLKYLRNEGQSEKIEPSKVQRNVAPDTDIDTDINQEEKEANAAFSQISMFYQNEIGPLSPIIRDKLLAMCKDFPPTWIPPAITLAVEQNVRKLSYVKGILENWQAIGGPQNDKPKSERQYKNGAKHGQHQQSSKRGIKALEGTGEQLDHEPTYDIYTNEYVYPDGRRERAT